MPRFNRLLITGAAGNLGRELRRGLEPLATALRITDRVDMQAFGDHEEVMPCELGDFDAVSRVVEGCDAIVHFGAAPVERPWEEVLESSIKGGYNVYEAARRHGIRRIVYASSIHAVGYERREAGADTDTPHNPDTLYGVSKCFVEDLGKMYFNKFGIESAMLRINSCYEKPADRRHLATWLSFRDLVHAIARDPAMLKYLDNDSNRRGNPNENFARELLELFTLGEGNYSEEDVRETARAFTGWTDREGSFRFVPRRHDYDHGARRPLG